MSTDKVPLARSASTTAYAATIAELASYTNGAYVPNYYTGAPSMDGTAAPGSLAFVARGDHVHPSDTARVAKAGDTMGGFLTLNANPTANLHAATKQYVDGSAPVGGPYLSVAAMHDVGRNLIHNALFTVAQRGAGPWAANGYTLDRWYGFGNLDVIGYSRQTFALGGVTGDEGARYTLTNAFTGNAGAAACSFVYQAIEDVTRLSNKTVTVSFWAAATSGTPKLGVSLDQNFGTGGSPSAQVNGAGQAITISTTYTRYSLTFTLASDVSKTLGTNGNDYTELNIWYSSGANNAARAGAIGVQSGTISIWGVQLEIGSVATPLEKRDPEQELRQCQRFYQAFTGLSMIDSATSGNLFGQTFMFPVIMRASPTVVLSAQTYTSASGLTNASSTPSSVLLYATASATGSVQFTTSLFVSADL